MHLITFTREPQMSWQRASKSGKSIAERSDGVVVATMVGWNRHAVVNEKRVAWTLRVDHGLNN